MNSALDPLVASGVQLMLVGMGTVFVFLTLLVFAVRVMSQLLGRIEPRQESASQRGSIQAVPPAHVAAIVGALEQHKSKAQ